MNCVGTLSDTLVFKELDNRVGSNKTQLAAYRAVIIKNNKENQSFFDWYESNFNEKPDFNSKEKAKEIADRIEDYYYSVLGSVSAHAISKLSIDENVAKGYTSVNARNEGLKFLGDSIIVYQSYDVINNSVKFDGKKEDYIKQKITDALICEMVAKIMTKREINLNNDDSFNYYYDKLYDLYETGIDDIIDFINEEFKDRNKEEQNFIALFLETIDDETYDKVISDLIISDSRISKAMSKIEKADKTENTNENKQTDENSTEENIDTNETESNAKESATDGTIRAANNHIGIYTSYKLHVDDDLHTFLSSIFKLNSTKLNNGNLDYNLNNELGVRQLMDADKIMNVLYTMIDYTTGKTMLSSIKHLAESIPELSGLIQIYNELNTNKDLRLNFYRTFSKSIITKQETVIGRDGISMRISNRKADRLSSLYFEYYNSSKRTSISLDSSIGDELYNEIVSARNTYLVTKKDSEDYFEFQNKLLDLITQALKRHCPTIDVDSIANYLLNNPVEDTESDNVAGNSKTLISIIKTLNDKAKETKLIYEKKINEYFSIKKLNKKLESEKRFDEIIDPSIVFATEYSTEMEGPTQQLANILVKYSTVKTELSSRNVHGNLSSDVINSSMITNLMKTLQSEVALKNYGDYKSLTRQYDLSNILVEHYDENGNRINLGLFKNVDGKFVPTDYAKDMLKVRLFNGAGDELNGNNVLYSEMSKGDYVAAAFHNFFDESKSAKTANGVISENDGRLSSYFMKIPSDAPKNFCIVAPRYSTGVTGNGLFDYSNLKDKYDVEQLVLSILDKKCDFEYLSKNKWYTDTKKAKYEKHNIEHLKTLQRQNPDYTLKEIEDIAENIRLKSIAEFNELIKNHKSYRKAISGNIKGYVPTRTIEEFSLDLYNIIEGNTKTINIGKHQIQEPSDKKGFQKIAFKIKLENGDFRYYIIEGQYVENNGVKQLINPSFAGFLKYHDELNHFNIVEDEIINSVNQTFIEQKILKGDIKRKVNTHHRMFKQFKQIFMQELTDAAVALDTIFVTDQIDGTTSSGAVNRNNGKPVFREGFDNSKETAKRLYDNYHVGVDSDGNNSPIIKDGKLTGKVFSSDRFTITFKKAKTIVYPDGTTREVKAGETINYLDELFRGDNPIINFLYGAGTNTYLHTKIGKNNNLEVFLTQEQEQAVDTAISNFLNDLITDSVERVQNYKDFIGKENNNIDKITEFTLNYYATYVGFNDLFEGDSKFYKNTQDLLKRSKEVQGSGVPYGVFDVTRPLIFNDGTTHEQGDLLEDSILNDVEFTRIDEQGNESTFKIEHRPKFRGITINNTISTGESIGKLDSNGEWIEENGKPVFGALSKKLYDIFIKEGYSEKDAIEKTKKMMKGYANTKTNDAQSYITFEEWVRRITGRGQFYKYKPLIDAILDESADIPLDLIQEFVQVQKNFYYDQHYNDKLHIIAPRQIKNAEFVLIPRFIKGTELEVVYNLMKENNIDQLNTKETSKAGNVNVLNLWDNNGVLTEENIEDFRKNASYSTELYDYNYLYTQSETPQHMDTVNKAAIQIMKKIVDNINVELDKDGNPTGLYAKKLEFFNLYYTNIQDSFIKLMKEFDIQTDKNGNIVLDENGNIANIDYDVFFKRLEDEVRRQGLDTNLLNYITPIAKGSKVTKIPMDMGVSSSKFESIAQSLFNTRVTRQTLPGYHAAQITNIGWNKTKFGDIVEKATYDKSLRYHPDGKPYVEIVLPKSAFKFSEEMLKMSDEELINYLEIEGLDLTIGYRIPTEGKQSACIFKLVGFTDAALGSTIVVPNDWVAQTGSDFDIDSVYGITHEYFTNEDGLLNKVKYNNKPSLYYWFNYVNSNIPKNERKDTKSEKRWAAIKQKVKDKRNEKKIKLQNKENILFKSLNKDLQENISEELAYLKESRNNNSASNADEYIENLDSQISVAKSFLENNANNLTEDEFVKIDSFIKTSEEIKDYVQKSLEGYNLELTNEISKTLEEEKEYLEDEAKKYNLKSFAEFSKNIPMQNSRAARNNQLLDIMIDILSDEKSLEENLSRSNFDDVIDAVNTCLEGTPTKSIRKNRSPYNFYDQADFQEDAMSGAKLKAFSVTRDTFVSVCNTVRPYVDDKYAIKINYKVNSIQDYYKIARIFGKENETTTDVSYDAKTKTVTVKHNKIGWSNNNHNIEDKILTAYDSQTTAHILDAIKEGAVPNVNDLTFGVYKTFTDLGSNYITSVAFMMQPGITRIVENYNANKSIFKTGNNNPFHTAIKQIARDLGVKINGELVTEKHKIDDVVKALNNDNLVLSTFKNIFGINENTPFVFDLEDKTMLSDIPIDSLKLLDRIKTSNKTTSPVERISGQNLSTEEESKFKDYLTDLFVALQYNRIKMLSDRITDFARVCNPDKFGAKQSIYATRKVIKDINNLISRESNERTIFVSDENNGEITFLEAIYPGISDGIDTFLITDGNSKYPSLYAFLKYATIPSIKINKHLFLTQDDSFVEEVEKIINAFTKDGNGEQVLTEKEYDNYKNYILNAIYKNSILINQPIEINITDETEDTKNFRERKYVTTIVSGDAIEEYRRVSCFGYSLQHNFTVKDINLPTSAEIKEYCKLSPIQKLAFIQDNFYDKGIFGYLDISAYKNKQNIQFNSGNISTQAAYLLFREAYFNNNPLIRLAAIDLVKYSFINEGFIMKKNGISTIIDTESLINDEISGLNLIDEIRNNISNIPLDKDTIYRNYIRSIYDSNRIQTYIVEKQENGISDLNVQEDGLIVLDNPMTELNEENPLIKYNIVYYTNDGSMKLNQFVKFKFNNKESAILYEICYNPGNNHVYLVPLNKLEANENEEFSSNEDNNVYPRREYYMSLIDEINNIPVGNEFDSKLAELIKDNRDNRTANSFVPIKETTERSAKPFSIDDDIFYDNKKLISEHFSKDNAESVFFFESLPLSNYITTVGTHDANTGEVFCSLQDIEITDKDGNSKTVTFKIVKADTTDVWKLLVNPNRKVDTGNKSKDDLVISKRKNNITFISNLYYAEEFKPMNETAIDNLVDGKDNIRKSSATERLTRKSIRGMQARAAQNGNQDAVKMLRRFDDKGIKLSDDSYKDKLSDAIELNSEYVTNTVESLINETIYFCKDENGVYHSINDDYTIELIKTNVEAREKYVRICNESRSLTKTYSIINDLDIDAEDAKDRKHLRKIKDYINKLETDSTINSAEERFVNDFLAKISTNPLVQSDMISLLDGYHSTSMMDCYIGDLQETSNPLLQIVTKEALADIRGKELLSKKRKEEWVKGVRRIEQAAAAAGLKIDYNHLFTDDGKLYQDFNEQLITDLKQFAEELNEARDKYGVASNEYLIAKLKYDEFKLDYIHQEAPDSYYRKKLDILKKLLVDPDDYSKGFIPVYRKYIELCKKRAELLSHMTENGILDDAYKDQLKNINIQINNLTTQYIVDADNNLIDRYEVDDVNNPFTGEDKEIYTKKSAKLLSYFISENKTNEDFYYEKNAKYGFEEELEKNLKIVNQYEERDEYGNLIRPLPVLMENEDYAKAKEWIENNATPVIPNSVIKAVREAYQVFNKHDFYRQSTGSLSSIARSRDAYDVNGIIDGTKLTDEDIEKIYEEQLDKYHLDFGNPHGDSVLITAVHRPLIVYKNKFYDNITRTTASNNEHTKLVQQINDILKKYYSPVIGKLHTSEISIEDSKLLSDLYYKLADTSKYHKGGNGRMVYEFVKDNVEFVYDEDSFNEQNELAKLKYGEESPEYKDWYNYNTELIKDDNGNYVKDLDGNYVIKPNHFLYGYMKPKDDSFIDQEKTKALQTIKNYTTVTKTKYYYEKLAEMRKKSKDEYNEWFKKNHIYNPYKHMIEPLPCWTQFGYNVEAGNNEMTVDDFTPKWSQTNKTLKKEFKFKNKKGEYYYTPNRSNAFNYKREVTDDDLQDNPTGTFYNYSRKDNKYDLNIPQNKYEKEMRDYIRDTLLSLASTNQSRRYFEEGYVPVRAKSAEHNAKYWGNQIKQFIGWINTSTGKDLWFDDSNIDISKDREMPMPMIGKLGQRPLKKVPKKNENESQEEYEERIKQIVEDNKVIEEENKQKHKDLLDTNFVDTISEFILKAGHFNAVQDNKQLLFFAKNMLERMDVYDTKVGRKNLIKDSEESTDESPQYIKKHDKYLEDQYVNWLRRLLYDQWKQPNEWLTRCGNVLQSLTSSKFMMMNITGGISNITLGFNQILGEGFAKEYFGNSNWMSAHKIYSEGLKDYLVNMYNEKSTTLSGAIIKFFNIVDFDEITGVAHGTVDAGTAIERFRNIMFSPQTMGEHYMQNTTMFAMLSSHRLVPNNDPNIKKEIIAGLPEYSVMNEAEYVTQALEKKIESLIGKERFKKYLEFKNKIKSDANEVKEYAQFRSDILTDFIKQNLTKDEKKQYVETKKQIKEKAKEEFNKAPTLHSQLELDSSTGTITFKKDSILSMLPESDSYKLLGTFKNRVISVNKKIHGVYDRLGSAKLESSWYGSLVMQYHKHLYPGIMKRWRRKGYWNEERGTVEKGFFWSVVDFISTPLNDTLKGYKNLDENEKTALKGLQMFARNSMDFIINFNLNKDILPDYERANMKRMAGDLIGFASAICLAIALRGIGGDDDKGKGMNIMYNLALYEADRLASESFMYNPIGLVAEAKTLWSSPVAAQSEITDLISVLGEIMKMIYEGDDYDGTYTTGLYAGENKSLVRVKRQIPVVRSMERIWNIDKSNNYYKIGTTAAGLFPTESVGNWLYDIIH